MFSVLACFVSGRSCSRSIIVLGNSFFGNKAGNAITTGGNNVFLGLQAASTTASGANNIVLGSGNGSGIDLPSTNGSNQLDIGNFIYGTGLSGTLSTVSSGQIGIGTTTSYSALTVWGPDSGASTTAFLVANSASTTEFYISDNGNAVLAGGLTQNSDQRLKTNIQSLDASSSLAAINALNPVTFNWIDPSKAGAQPGFIAQQVFPIFPDLISTTSPTALTPDGTLGLNYTGLIAPIVRAIQALSAEITSIENTIGTVDCCDFEGCGLPKPQAAGVHQREAGLVNRVPYAAQQTA
jgi:hypothetical protein